MYYLAIDQGTTGSTALILDSQSFNIKAKGYCEFTQHYPKEGQVEHDLTELFQSVITAINIATLKIDKSKIRAIGITNQRETACAFDKKGTPLCKAIVWQDRRTSSYCKELQSLGFEQTIRFKTGLKIDPYFSASKFKWLIDNNTNIQKMSEANNLLFGTIDTFILFKLTNCTSYLTDSTNASRTSLFNIKTHEWDDELFSIFQLNKKLLPDVQENFSFFGVTKNLTCLPDGIPITAMIGDQQSALLGHGDIAEGAMKCTYGTGGFLVTNTGALQVDSKSGMLATIAYRNKGKTTYALEGSTYICGAAVQWIRDNLELIKNSADIEQLALESIESNRESLIFMPYFTGVGTPHWNSNILASITGIHRGTNKADIAAAALEGIVISIDELIRVLEKELNCHFTDLNVDGGATVNNLLMQMQSDFSNLNIKRPSQIELTGIGAGYAAAIGNNDLKLEDLALKKKDITSFIPNNKKQNYVKNKIQLWNKIYNSLR